LKVIKKDEFKDLLKTSFEKALKKDESSDIIKFEIEVNSIYSTIKYDFETEVHNESSCIHTIEALFKENIKKYVPEDTLDIRLIVHDKTFYINSTYTIGD